MKNLLFIPLMVLVSMIATIAQTPAPLTKHQGSSVIKSQVQKSEGKKLMVRNSSVGDMRFLRSLRALRALRFTHMWGFNVKENYETSLQNELLKGNSVKKNL